MFLSKIELIGFKSFANKTIFRFNGGITAIIGPNGCGKTNIVDAVRWVLGEQRTTLLRSEIMEDVIFNGSSNRKPFGMAEVSITFQNDKQIIPAHFSEITFTRRLFRNGESTYLLNNTPCRLKDINELLMDTGVGANSYSVIELKMIESLLNGNVDERRRLIEEAAGITKYKSRKKETTKKLSSVQEDLIRIYDIVTEIEKHVNSLSRQASKTRKYNKLHEQLKKLEISLWNKEFKEINSTLKKIESENSNLQSSKEKLLVEQQNLTTEINTLEKKIEEIDININDYQSRESELLHRSSSLKQSIAVNNEKINSLLNDLRKIETENSDSEEWLFKNDQIMKKLLKLKAQKESELLKLNEFLSTIQKDYFSISNEINQRRKKIETEREKVVHTQNQIKFLQLQIDKLESSLKQDQNRENFLMNEIDNLKQACEKNIATRKNIELALSEVNEKITELKKNSEKFSNIEKSINLKVEKWKSKLTEKNLELREITTSLEFLDSILEVDESTKFLLGVNSWKSKSKAMLLGEILGIDESLRIAYNSLLGDYKNILIVEKNEDVESAFSLLLESKKGKCFFVVLDNLKINVEPPNLKLPNNAIGFASEIPLIDTPIKILLRLLFGNAIIVNDFKSALEISKDNVFPLIVTLAGEIITKGIIQKRGSVLNREGLSIGKIERIAKLKSMKHKIEGELQEINHNIDLLISELNENYSQQELTLLKINNLEVEKTHLVEGLNKIDSDINSLNLKLESKKQELIKTKENFEKYIFELEELKQQLAASTTELESLKSNFEQEQSDFETIQKEHQVKLDKLRQVEKNIVEIRTELKNLQSEINRVNSNIERLKQKLLRIANEKKESQNTIENLKNANEPLLKEIESINLELQDVKNHRFLLEERREELNSILDRQMEYRDRMIDQIEKVTLQSHQNEVRYAQLTEYHRSLFQKAIDTYSINLNDVTELDYPEVDTEVARYEIDKLKNALNTLGEINFLALREFEEHSQRLEFYKKQIRDLKDSERSLKEALNEINVTAENKFIETFEKVNENFRNVFRQLFGGDSTAELTIDRENLLESDIEINAKPSGKRMLSIDALSQGEKTLTALSFLFALYLVKPSPFCILDEVDAPLDDANVERFLNLLHFFSNDVQFILITHNKRTMEAADTLYGISMAEDGVSKVLSVRLVE